MLFQNMDRNDLQQVLTQLDQALYHHNQWYKDLVRTFVCRLPSDKSDMLPDAHKNCRFGQWYYDYDVKSLNNHPGFIAIGEAHQRMHELANNILTNVNANNVITAFDYDNFANSLERLQLEIYALKNELEVLLYNRDPLTMTINRVNMLPLLREQQELAKRQFQSFCIAMVDLDSFKKINDQYGHPVGDKILAALAHYLIDHLRPYDKIFRYGGDEFLLCIQKITLSQAFEMMNRMRQEIAALKFDVGLREPLHVTISCGITMLDPTSPVELSIDRADKALYAAKSAGRNRVENWSDGMGA